MGMSLCACGCGKVGPGKWRQGHNPKNKGRRFTVEHRRKLSESNKGKQAGAKHPNWGRHLSEETRRKIGDAQRGRVITPEMRLKISATKLAKGASTEMAAIHRWMLRWHPKTGACEHCGAQGKTDFASVNGHNYTRNREDYAELCPSCHLEHDYTEGRRRSQRGTPKPRRSRS